MFKVRNRHRLGAVLLAMVIILTATHTAIAAPSSTTAREAVTVSSSNHTLAIKADGSLWSWGWENFYGELGDGTKDKPLEGPRDTSGRIVPVKILDDVAAVSAGRMNNSMAIKTDGTLWAWGYVNGIDPDRLRPVKIMDNVKAVAAGGYEDSLIIKTDNSLYSISAMGDTVKIMDNVAAISAGLWHSTALKTDGTLWAWGQIHNRKIVSSPVKVMDNVKSFSASDTYTLAIRADGSLWGWGSPYQEGVTPVVNSPDKPVKIMTNAAAVSAGRSHAMVIKTDGSLWGWGNNEAAVIGDGTCSDTHFGINNNRPNPIKIMDGVVAVEAGDWNTFAIKADGSLWGWGRYMGVDIQTKISSQSGKEWDGTGKYITYPEHIGTVAPKKVWNNVKM